MGGTLLFAARLCLLLMAAAPLVYYILSLFCVFEFFRRGRRGTATSRGYAPPVSMLKPVRGMDHGAYENFASFCLLDYPEYEILFAVADTDDPVIPVIEQLKKDFPHRSIRLITRIAQTGANRKVNSLCRLVAEARYDLLVMSDSDVRVEPDYLYRVVAPFADSRVGGVTTLCRCLPANSLASRLKALGFAIDSAPAALVARKIEGKVQFAFGWTMATTRAHLAEIGGWEAMANHHSDDFELGNRLARRGYRVELLREPVGMVLPAESFRQYLKSELRWAIGLRNVRPIGYWGVALTHALPWSLLAFLVGRVAHWPILAWAYPVAYLLLRLGLTRATTKSLNGASALRDFWLVPLRDACSFIVWLAAFFFHTITWRELDYRVEKGVLIPLHRDHAAS
jgi:ceramide glucosyltransferase